MTFDHNKLTKIKLINFTEKISSENLQNKISCNEKNTPKKTHNDLNVSILEKLLFFPFLNFRYCTILNLQNALLKLTPIWWPSTKICGNETSKVFRRSMTSIWFSLHMKTSLSSTFINRFRKIWRILTHRAHVSRTTPSVVK